MKPEAPYLDWAALSPIVALTVGACLVLLTGLLRARWARTVLVPWMAVATFGAAIGLSIWQWGENTEVIENALAIDDLALAVAILCSVTGIGTVALSGRAVAPREAGHGEYYALLIAAVLGMVILAGAQSLVALFLGFELLSIPLYVLCATEMRREHSLESGLKYLIIGSVGSATLLYGLALLYGATGSTDFAGIASAIGAEDLGGDVLFLTSLALITTGLAFKASIAPFHQWTPDVYEGAPTPITAFMAVATKAAAFGVLLRLFDVALIDAAFDWAPALSVLAVASIVIGNVGAIGQTSLKRLLAYSSIAQAGYMLVGVVVSTKLGVQSVIFYLAVYLLMNLAAFAVIVARERETGRDDDISTLHGLGADRPVLAWSMTIAMLALAGMPGTAGFFGKIFLIQASVDNGWAWLGVAIVVGSAISLAYYLRVVAAVWMRAPGEGVLSTRLGTRAVPVVSGGAGEEDTTRPEPAGEPGDHAGAGRRAPDDVTEGPGVPGRGPSDTPGALHGDPDPGNAPGGGRAGEEPAAESEELARTPHVRQPEVIVVAAVCAVLTIVAGLYPGPLFDAARDAGDALTNLL